MYDHIGETAFAVSPRMPQTSCGRKEDIMTREEVFDKLTEVFRTVFDDDSIILSDSTTSADIEDWDSLEHIDLIVSVEKAFGMKFTMSETTGMKNVGEMADIILSRI